MKKLKSTYIVTWVLIAILFSNLKSTPVASAAALYPFTAHTFTNCTATGQNGPTLANCTTAYSSATWSASTSNFDVASGIQSWKVPTTGIYTITAVGSAGGNGGNGAGGKGMSITVTFTLTSGQILKIIVGQKGTANAYVAGGGGGTFVYSNATDTYPLMAAGGGGGGAGGGTTGYTAGINAVATQNGTNGNNATSGAGTSGGGGVVPSYVNYALGGAGWLSNGNISNYTCTNRGVASLAPRNGATGGNSNQAGTFGGFGGGGAPAMMCGAIAGGGGGGYSGGGPGAENPSSFFNGGGGGGSYNGGSSPVTNGAINSGTGSVTITLITVAAANITSFNLTGNAITATYRNAVNIIAVVDISSKVSFKAGGVRIPGCTNISTTGSSPNFTATCSWKPSRRGKLILSAVATPMSGGDSGANQTPLIVAVGNRTGNR
jgi:hypothetical protein